MVYYNQKEEREDKQMTNYRPTTAHKAITARNENKFNTYYTKPIVVKTKEVTKEQIEAYKAKCNVKRQLTNKIKKSIIKATKEIER